jgi:hypothetical protein
LDGGALTAGLQVLIDDREWSDANLLTDQG